MITDLCPACWLYHAPAANCKEANALGQAWLVKPPVDDPLPVSPLNAGPITSTIRLKRPYKRKEK